MKRTKTFFAALAPVFAAAAFIAPTQAQAQNAKTTRAAGETIYFSGGNGGGGGGGGTGNGGVGGNYLQGVRAGNGGNANGGGGQGSIYYKDDGLPSIEIVQATGGKLWIVFKETASSTERRLVQ